MALLPGTRVGAYEIVGALGAGGMGEVYRARDTRLGRSAAIKTLPAEFALDEDRRLRFEREARTLAALNHPHIAQVYGLEELTGANDGQPALALAMELVEGEDLAQRLARGALPIDDAWPIARQIAAGLEAAHEAGIVHRDLKPANVRVTADGVVKVLDFGLAKPVDPPGAGADLTHSPTLTSPALTTRGVVLGTAAYMAPEQAKGRPVDRRADIWAFGCVVYELLTGRRAFDGEDVTEILGAIVKTEPDWSKLPPVVNARVRAVLRRCLAKDRTERWQHIGDVRLALAEALAELAGDVPTPVVRRTTRAGWIAAAIAATVAAGLGVALTRPAAERPRPVTRFSIPLDEGFDFTNTGRHVLALSPDGSTLVFVANRRLFRRDLATEEVRPIPGTETRTGILEPVFSPDGQFLAFFSNDERAIKTSRLDGSENRTVCPVESLFGMSWGATGILFAERDRGIMRVPAVGGVPELVAPTTPPQVAASPHELPGTTWIAFSHSEGAGVERWDRGAIVARDPVSGEQRVLVPSATDSHVAGRTLVYRSRATLYAAELGPDGLSLTGPPVSIVERVRTPALSDTNPPTGQVAVSSAGVLAYLEGSASSLRGRGLAIVDRDGNSAYLNVTPGELSARRASPDGRFVAFVLAQASDTETSIWILDRRSGDPARRLTSGVVVSQPVWSADGRWVYFGGAADGIRGLWRQRADGSSPRELLAKFAIAGGPETVAPDGATVFLSDYVAAGQQELATWSPGSDRIVRLGTIQSTRPLHLSVSTDGRWLAYVDSTAPGPRVVVEPWPRTGARYELPHPLQAFRPVWVSGRTSLMYEDASFALWMVEVTTSPTFQFGRPRELRRGPAAFMGGGDLSFRSFDPIPGTDSFVAVSLPEGQTPAPAGDERRIHVILNWQGALRARPAAAQ